MHWRESNQRSGFGEPGGDGGDQNDDIGDLFGDGGNHHQNGDLSGVGETIAKIFTAVMTNIFSYSKICQAFFYHHSQLALAIN